ncbi:MAG: regulatory protein RecX [Desulfuromonadaceae bacterium]|nr:regulatory protein RecX [Desulfuromonadaceae bacterium]
MKRKRTSRIRPPGKSDAFQQALLLLTGRDHSEAELAAKLRRRQFSPEEVTEALRRCREYGYVDDRRYALMRARSLMAEGRAVGFRLAADLRRRGLDGELAESALKAAAEEIPLEDLLEKIFFRRFSGFDFENADSRERSRVVNYFLRRGFPLEGILQFISKKGSQRKE